MICNYDGCGCGMSEKKQSPCMNGIMILVSIIGGLLFTTAAVLLFVFSLITTVGFIAWVALITGLVLLLTLLIFSFTAEDNCKAAKCTRCYLGGLLFGIFGSIFTGLLGIATSFAAIAVFPAVILGLVSFFFAYMIISTLFLIKCNIS